MSRYGRRSHRGTIPEARLTTARPLHDRYANPGADVTAMQLRLRAVAARTARRPTSPRTKPGRRMDPLGSFESGANARCSTMSGTLLARVLGLFSLGLGIAQLVMPRRFATWIGLR